MRDGHEYEVLSQRGGDGEGGQVDEDVGMPADEGDELEQLAGEEDGGAEDQRRPQVHLQHHRVSTRRALGPHPLLNGARHAVQRQGEDQQKLADPEGETYK